MFMIGSIPILQIGKGTERNRVCNFAKITLWFSTITIKSQIFALFCYIALYLVILDVLPCTYYILEAWCTKFVQGVGLSHQ